MSKSIVVISHSGKEELNELIAKLVLVKLTSELNLKQHNGSIRKITIHKEK